MIKIHLTKMLFLILLAVAFAPQVFAQSNEPAVGGGGTVGAIPKRPDPAFRSRSTRGFTLAAVFDG